jgi:hypothetical protein
MAYLLEHTDPWQEKAIPFPNALQVTLHRSAERQANLRPEAAPLASVG